MKKLVAAIGFLALVGCGVEQQSEVKKTTQGLTCETAGQVPIYKNRFQPFSGSSGVASGADAAAGRISEDAPAGPTAPPVDTQTSGPLTAMSESCGTAICAPGEVAVEELPRSGGGGVGGVGAPAGGGDFGGDALPPTPPPAPPAAKLLCTTPPPACPAGTSPQFTSKHVWECTDCGLVVTFGGIFGNYRRCVNMPKLTCPTGEVPTFGLEDETWQCKPTCDNGMYDQHTVSGVLVCVPC
jgi:hypothetical protein